MNLWVFTAEIGSLLCVDHLQGVGYLRRFVSTLRTENADVIANENGVMIVFVGKIEARYGTVENYSSSIGIDDTRQQRIREKMLGASDFSQRRLSFRR